MGRPLRLACDNCVPGDASAWTLPILAAVVLALALAVVCLRASARRPGARAVAAKVAALALTIGPLGGAFVASMPLTVGGTACGSALSASLLRGRPDDAALDARQAGCKSRGEALVRGAAAWAVTSAVAAGALVAGSSLPRRRAAYA